jgi:hypothetical protein
VRYDFFDLMFLSDFRARTKVRYENEESSPCGVVSLIATFFECVAEVRDSPNSLRIEMKTYHIMLTMGMY